MKKVKIVPIRWVSEKHDSDFDGVPDHKDCQPLNPRKQDAAPEHGVFQINKKEWGVYAQQLNGATFRRRGKPFFIGSKYDCGEFVKRIPKPEAHYDSEVTYQR